MCSLDTQQRSLVAHWPFAAAEYKPALFGGQGGLELVGCEVVEVRQASLLIITLPLQRTSVL